MSENEKTALDRALDGVDVGRRDFMRKVVLTTAFVVPTVASFAVDGMLVSRAMAGDSSNVS
jgi:hypothetical protein